MTPPADGGFSDSLPRLGEPAGRRLAFLVAEGEEGAWDDAGTGGPAHRLLAFLLAIAHAHLAGERSIDDLVAGTFQQAFRDPSVPSSAQFLLSLLDARKIRASDVLGIVPAESPRARALNDELRDLLRSARLEAEGRFAVAGDCSAAPPPSSLPLLARFVRDHLEGEIIVAASGSGPISLPVAVKPPFAPSSEPSAHFLRRDGSRLPLHPFVLVETGAPAFIWDIEEGQVRWLPADGQGMPAPREGIPAEAIAEFLLRMGGYTEARDWLRTIPAAERDALPRATLLLASACHQGALALRQRDLELAVGELEKAGRARPDLLLPQVLLAHALLGQKHVERAIEVLKRHAVHFSRSDRLFELIGDAHRQRKDAATALRMYEKAASVNPLNVQVERKRDLIREQLRKERDERTASLGAASASGQSQGATGGPAPAVKLEDYLVDMTLEAELGLYQGCAGRDEEIRQLVEILACRDKRNPLLLGDPGVGKTALIEDFASRLVSGRLPKRFAGRKIWMMSVATLLAGAKYRGQFEERVLDVVKLLKGEDALIFVDNIHQLVSSGLTRGGALDASSLLKPYLVKGEIQVIGATTHDEFRQGMEKDASLLRCFQVVLVEEPSVEAALPMIEHVCSRYEQHHRIVVPPSLLRATLPLIAAALRDRALPDKALDVLDRACSVAAMRRDETLAMRRDETLAMRGDETLAMRRDETLAMRREGSSSDLVELTKDDVLGVLSEMSRVPLARLGEETRDTLAHLESSLSERVMGQPDAVARVSRVVRAARLGLMMDARRPKGVFLFVGPSGVGKTELARAMALQLFGSAERLIRIDMSEYRERINQSRLIGTAPGYVGYNDQNQLTDEVRKNPHSLVLLDEIEKADHDMMHLFLQVFDAGRLTDGKGRTVHFDHATIVMTSNIGTHLFSRSALGFEEGRGARAQVAVSDVMREVRRHFAPEFLNRLDEIICFDALSPAIVERIARQKIQAVADRLRAQGKQLVLLPAATSLLASAGYSPDEGARNLERVIRRLLLEPLAARALEPGWDEAAVVRVGARNGELTFEVASGGGNVPLLPEAVSLESLGREALDTEDDSDPRRA